MIMYDQEKSDMSSEASDSLHIGSTQLLNCQWNSSDIDTCQMLKYQSSEP